MKEKINPTSKKKKTEEDKMRKTFLKNCCEFTVILFLIYLVIGASTFWAVAAGADSIPYMSFWHAPWRLFFDFLDLLRVL